MRVLQTAPAPGRTAADASPGSAPGGGALSSGMALPEDVRGRMERSLGADFSAVRVHIGEAAPAVGARAYAQGSDLHFAPGEYQPETARGQELIGHELTHVVQQAEGRVPVTQQRKGQGMNDDSSLEREADERGAKAARGEPAGGETSSSGRVAAGPSSAPLQRMKFLPDGNPFDEGWDDEESGAKTLDTASIEEFAQWLGTLKVAQLELVYSALCDLSKPKRDEAMARSRAKLLLDSKGEHSGKDQANNPLAELDKNKWWKLFIDKGAHKDNESNATNAMRFDGESSPGFYDAMMSAYEQVLAGTESGKREKLSPNDLFDIHKMVTQGTLSKDGGTFEPTPHELSGRGTQYPMLKGEDDVPSISGFEELAKDGVITLRKEMQNKGKVGDGDGSETRFRKLSTQASEEGAMTVLLPFSKYLVNTNYESEDAKGVMKFLLDAYYEEMKSCDLIENEREQDQSKLRAIVRVIRGLHTAHVFTDANGRLNTMVLLNKFLMEEGFDPVIMDDTSVFGGGFNIEQLVGQVRRGMNTFSEEIRGEAVWGTVIRDKGWYSYRENPRPNDIRAKLLHVVRIDLDKVPEKHVEKVKALMQRYRGRAWSQTYRRDQIEALGFKKSMDALLLENELETFTRD